MGIGARLGSVIGCSCTGSEWMITPEGGLACRLTNRTGAPSVKGLVLVASTTYDRAVNIAPAGAVSPIGVFYESGVADGAQAWVVVGGIADVLIKDGTTATRAYWVQTSDVAGRADITLADPNPATHWDEMGHCIESKALGVNVLARIVMHFN